MTKRIFLLLFICLMLFPVAFAYSYDDYYEEWYDEIYEAVYDEIYDEIYDKGYEYGYDDGYNEGYDSGYDYGYDNGEENGYDAGYSECESVLEDEHYTSLTKILWALIVAVILALIFAYYWYYSNTECLRLKAKIDNLQDELRNTITNDYREKCEAIKDREDKIRYLSEELELETQKRIEIQRNFYEAKNHFDKQGNQLKTVSSLPLPPKPIPKLITFGDWAPGSHDTEAQFQKFIRAQTEPIKIKELAFDGAHIIGTTGNAYNTTLNSCTCLDFKLNTHGTRPCKHIYFLAIKNGIPVEDIFEDYMKP